MFFLKVPEDIPPEWDILQVQNITAYAGVV